jgi:hypothetical protein
MKTKLQYQHVDRSKLAAYLAQHEISSAEALEQIHIYCCLTDHDESLVIALPDGSGLIVTNDAQTSVDRRRNAG